MSQLRPSLALSCLTLVTLVTLVAASCTPTPDGPCDPKALAELRGALPKVDDDQQRGLIAAVGLGEACGNKLPGDVGKTLIALGGVSPADRATLLAAALSENPSFSERGCPDFKRTFAAVASVVAADRARILYDGCGWAKLNLATVEEIDVALRGESGTGLLAPPMYQWLVDKRMEPAEARKLARAMLGLQQ